MMIKNFREKFIYLFLTVLLVATYASPTYYALATSNTESTDVAQSETITVNGYKIEKTTTDTTMSLSMNSDGYHVRVNNDYTLKQITTSITDSSGKMVVNQTASTAPLNGISLGDLARIGSKVHLAADSRYWYQVDGNYIRIGCIAKYKVKNTNSHVKAYRSAIQSSNSYIAGTGISATSLAIVCGIVGAATALVPPVAVAGLIVGAVTVGSGTATKLYKGVAKANVAKEEYDMAKIAGKKY
ncbi:hypothetical protein [Lacticaseibacillus sharpeae]|nr:hypothetical protein [Lacticaseibacillus sharpeae]